MASPRPVTVVTADSAPALKRIPVDAVNEAAREDRDGFNHAADQQDLTASLGKVANPYSTQPTK